MTGVQTCALPISGSNPSADQNIRNGSGDCHTHYPNNYFTLYAIRDTGPAGGLIFYINPNYIADGWLYLEAAPSKWYSDSGDPKSVWSNIVDIAIGTTDTAIGTGKANTDAIIGQTDHTGSAAKLCRDYRGGGKDDWFLPSLEELNLMCDNLYKQTPSIGGLTLEIYWSSSEKSGLYAYVHSFGSDRWGDDYKNFPHQVRAVRYF